MSTTSRHISTLSDDDSYKPPPTPQIASYKHKKYRGGRSNSIQDTSGGSGPSSGGPSGDEEADSVSETMSDSCQIDEAKDQDLDSNSSTGSASLIRRDHALTPSLVAQYMTGLGRVLPPPAASLPLAPPRVPLAPPQTSALAQAESWRAWREPLSPPRSSALARPVLSPPQPHKDMSPPPQPRHAHHAPANLVSPSSPPQNRSCSPPDPWKRSIVKSEPLKDDSPSPTTIPIR